MISGVSILSVSDEPKKIYDLGVFTITSVFSLFAYIWLFLCLQDDVIDITEAWLTLLYFFLLIILAFGADKFNQSRRNAVNTLPENESEIDIEKRITLSKGQLRSICKQIGDQSVLQVAQGQHNEQFQEDLQVRIKELFMEALRLRSPKELSHISLDVLSEVIKPECPVERIGAKKANKLSHNKDFLKLTGEKDEKTEDANEVENRYIGFRGQQYNVVESIGFVEIVI